VARDYAAAYFYSTGVASDAARSALRAKLVDAGGVPNLGVAKVLTWSYRRADKLDEWATYVEGRAADTAVTPDARSSWMVIRALVEEGRNYFPDPLGGRKWLDRAIATAGSDRAAADAVALLAQRYALADRPQDALSLLDSVGGRFKDAGATQRLAGVRAVVLKAQADSQKRHKDEDQRVALDRLRNERVRLAAQLAQARQRKLPDDQQRQLQNKLDDANGRLQQLGNSN
jgi:hypothetical protein